MVLTFPARRKFEKLFIDKLDYLYRLATGRRDLPPYSLRRFVGGAHGFEKVGPWFISEFTRLELLRKGCRILDVGCGCGRLASAFARDPALTRQGVSYIGMDIDRDSIEWCQRKITPINPLFNFYHADLHNAAYNPAGKLDSSTYRFPHEDGSFDLIVATSLFTHLIESEAAHYLREMHRLLAPEGRIFSSFFLYKDEREAVEGTGRHGLKFPVYQGNVSFAREGLLEGAVAFREQRVLDLLRESGLELATGIFYGTQDNLLLRKL